MDLHFSSFAHPTRSNLARRVEDTNRRLQLLQSIVTDERNDIEYRKQCSKLVVETAMQLASLDQETAYWEAKDEKKKRMASCRQHQHRSSEPQLFLSPALLRDDAEDSYSSTSSSDSPPLLLLLPASTVQSINQRFEHQLEILNHSSNVLLNRAEEDIEEEEDSSSAAGETAEPRQKNRALATRKRPREEDEDAEGEDAAFHHQHSTDEALAKPHHSQNATPHQVDLVDSHDVLPSHPSLHRHPMEDAFFAAAELAKAFRNQRNNQDASQKFRHAIAQLREIEKALNTGKSTALPVTSSHEPLPDYEAQLLHIRTTILLVAVTTWHRDYAEAEDIATAYIASIGLLHRNNDAALKTMWEKEVEHRSESEDSSTIPCSNDSGDCAAASKGDAHQTLIHQQQQRLLQPTEEYINLLLLLGVMFEQEALWMARKVYRSAFTLMNYAGISSRLFRHGVPGFLQQVLCPGSWGMVFRVLHRAHDVDRVICAFGEKRRYC